MLPGETLNLYVHELKHLLQQAMPDLQAAAKEQQLLHQFLTGLPAAVSEGDDMFQQLAVNTSQ